MNTTIHSPHTTTGGAGASRPSTPTWREIAADVWRTEPLLSATALILLLLALPSAAGVWLDPRVITGAPAWLKPFKFAVSTAIYTATLAWVFTYLPGWPRVRRFVGRTTAVVMFGELAVIDLQAWRGTPSHFNIGTPLDAALFMAMGSAIVLQTLTTIAVAVALWRQAFDDKAMGWALRLGMTLTIIGAFTGALMTRPTHAQLAEAETTHRMTVSGAHTVGGVDGGPGLPGTGWSTQHGDVRVPHFVGLHALQALIVFAFLFRRRPERARVRLTLTAAGIYGVLFVLLLVQALQGVPFLRV